MADTGDRFEIIYNNVKMKVERLQLPDYIALRVLFRIARKPAERPLTSPVATAQITFEFIVTSNTRILKKIRSL